MATVEPEVRTQRNALIWAIVAILFVQKVVPFGGLLLYPFTLLGTWVHEMGHGMTALIVGGTFERLYVFANASGLAFTAVAPGWRQGLVSLGGLLGPPLVGAAVLLVSRGPRRARTVLFALAGALALSLLIWVRSVTGWIAMPIVTLGLGLVAWKASSQRRLFVAQLIGALLALDTVSGLDYLFRENVFVDGRDRASDIANVAIAFGGHYLVWGFLVAGVSLAAVGAALWLALRKVEVRSSRARRV